MPNHFIKNNWVSDKGCFVNLAPDDLSSSGLLFWRAATHLVVIAGSSCGLREGVNVLPTCKWCIFSPVKRLRTAAMGENVLQIKQQ